MQQPQAAQNIQNLYNYNQLQVNFNQRPQSLNYIEYIAYIGLFDCSYVQIAELEFKQLADDLNAVHHRLQAQLTQSSEQHDRIIRDMSEGTYQEVDFVQVLDDHQYEVKAQLIDLLQLPMNEKNTAKYISARFKIRISFKHDYANKYKSAGKPDFKDVKFNYALSENQGIPHNVYFKFTTGKLDYQPKYNSLVIRKVPVQRQLEPKILMYMIKPKVKLPSLQIKRRELKQIAVKVDKIANRLLRRVKDVSEWVLQKNWALNVAQPIVSLDVQNAYNNISYLDMFASLKKNQTNILSEEDMGMIWQFHKDVLALVEYELSIGSHYYVSNKLKHLNETSKQIISTYKDKLLPLQSKDKIYNALGLCNYAVHSYYMMSNFYPEVDVQSGWILGVIENFDKNQIIPAVFRNDDVKCIQVGNFGGNLHLPQLAGRQRFHNQTGTQEKGVLCSSKIQECDICLVDHLSISICQVTQCANQYRSCVYSVLKQFQQSRNARYKCPFCNTYRDLTNRLDNGILRLEQC